MRGRVVSLVRQTGLRMFQVWSPLGQRAVPLYAATTARLDTDLTSHWEEEEEKAISQSR